MSSRCHSALVSTSGHDDEGPQGAPADPAGTDDCVFYRTTAERLSPAYRLCFAAGRLSHKDEVRISLP